VTVSLRSRLGRNGEKGTRCEFEELKSAAAPATVGGERRFRVPLPSQPAGRRERGVWSRKPGDLPARVAHHQRGARWWTDHRSGDDSV